MTQGGRGVVGPSLGGGAGQRAVSSRVPLDPRPPPAALAGQDAAGSGDNTSKVANILNMLSIHQRIREIDWGLYRIRVHNIFIKLIRTRNPNEPEGAQGSQEGAQPGAEQGIRLTRCLTTRDLTSLGVGSCVGTGMYLVTGMVASRFAGPGVAASFVIAAIASLFSGVCYAEFGVRVPNTTGSAYMYSYVTVGEFVAFVVGWNMVLEYVIGTSACARALSACINTLFNGAIERSVGNNVGTLFGKPPDVLAFGITLMMTMVLVAGVKKSLAFNNVLNAVNLTVWVFIITAGIFYIDVANWTEHKGFLPYGWSGVFSGAATCFYAFIGFDIIATTGEEANNPKKSIPLAIILSLGIITIAYVSCSFILTLMVPYDQVDTTSALVQMFDYVDAPTCKFIVALGALAGLTVAMFGSMFPMPRILYAMAQDGLIYRPLSVVSPQTSSPTFATVIGGITAALVSLVVQLEILVEMMSIGTLIAYTLVATCVLILRYQPNANNLIELLPHSLRTPIGPEGTAGRRETTIEHDLLQVTSHTQLAPSQRIMIRRVTQSSPDSDDTIPDDSEEYFRDDTYLMNPTVDNNKFYGNIHCGLSGGTTRCGRFFNNIYRRLQGLSYLCPGLFPWVENGPASEASGIFVVKAVGIMFVLIIIFDLLAAYATPSSFDFTAVVTMLLFFAIFTILLMISRKPQNRINLIYLAPWLPFVPTIAVTINIYLILNLSILTLLRFTIWMVLGLIVYFKYGIKNSVLENPPAQDSIPPLYPNPLDRATIPPISSQPRPIGDRNIFEGDGNNRMFGSDFSQPVLTWHVSNLTPLPSSSYESSTSLGISPGSENTRDQANSSSLRGTSGHTFMNREHSLKSGASNTNTGFKQIETRYDAKTDSVSLHTSSRPPWANPDSLHGNWDD
ncbi:probable cationic amino acid transporter [Papilio machaon]|uniref:probable cationic amino acid transporter n=1 Tax=Papilio machaon TaxID=76193 RepID=UPI001E662AF1|nr:probable cationic amino acid transporter [Papilio machaon]